MCLLTGATEPGSGQTALITNHTPLQTHTHTVMLTPDKADSMFKSIHTDPGTLAHMYGTAKGSLDLCGFTGIKIEGATTTHMGPVGITFGSTHPDDPETFVPIQSLTRSCFQHQEHATSADAHDAGQLVHFIANPCTVGYVHPPVEMKFHESQCADDMATNLCLRRAKWPTMPMETEGGFNTIVSETHGPMAAIPLTQPPTCNVAYLIDNNRADLAKIGGPGAKIVKSTAGDFAMITQSSLDGIKEKLSSSFESKSVLNGGLTINMFPLTGEPMAKDCTTTLTYSLMKDPRPISERAMSAMMDSTSTEMSHIERIHLHNVAGLLGDDAATSASVVAAVAPSADQLQAELSTLVNA